MGTPARAILARHGIAENGTVQLGTARHGTVLARKNLARHGTAQPGTEELGTARHRKTWHSMPGIYAWHIAWYICLAYMPGIYAEPKLANMGHQDDFSWLPRGGPNGQLSRNLANMGIQDPHVSRWGTGGG